MSEPLVDRQFLEKLERLTLQWQRSFPGLVGGHNMSHFAGAGQEFLDHRNFHPGDDLRAINWRAYMRFDKVFLKLFQIEPRVPVRLLLDVSGSMLAGAPPGDLSKFDYGRKLAAALVYVGLVRLDSVLLQPFASQLQDPYSCGGGRHRFQPAERFLRGLRPGGETRLIDLARQFLDRYPQRGLIILISDFLTAGDALKALQYIADYGHELVLIQLWGEDDRYPLIDGDVQFVDAETGQELEVSVDDGAREEYREAFDAHAASLEKLALRNRGRYAGLSTRVPMEELMFGPLTMVGAKH